MNNIRLQELYNSSTYRGTIQMELLRYINYQISVNYAGMTEEYKAKFITLEKSVFHNLDIVTDRLSKIIIGDPAVAALNCYHEFTDEIANQVIGYVIQNKIDKLIDS